MYANISSYEMQTCVIFVINSIEMLPVAVIVEPLAIALRIIKKADSLIGKKVAILGSALQDC